VRLNLSHLIKVSPLIWAVSIAAAVQLFAPEIWWHPDCNLSEPFNQSAAAGLPLPYVQRSVATSDFFYMPHIMLLNLLIVAGVALPLTLFLVRWSVRARRAQVIQAVASLIVFGLLLVLLLGMILVLEPTRSIASSNESYFDYRPVIGGFKTTGGSRCVR
jgi:hypothetical protein